MSNPRNIVVVSGGIGHPSSSRALADGLTEATAAALRKRGADIETTAIEVRELAADLVTAVTCSGEPPAVTEAIARIREADALIAVTPVFNGGYSGMFKMFLDVLPPRSLAGVPTIIGATGGTARHSLVLDYALRPVFSYLGALTVPTGVFAANTDVDEGVVAEALRLRVLRAGEELAALMPVGERRG